MPDSSEKDEKEKKPAGMRKEPGEDARPLTRSTRGGPPSTDQPQQHPTRDSRPMTEEPFDAGVQSGAPTQSTYGNPEQANVKDERDREERRFMHQENRHQPGYHYHEPDEETSIGARDETSPAIDKDETTDAKTEEQKEREKERTGGGEPI